MAKVKGNDVFLELMDTVAALEKSMGEQALRTSRVENSVRVLEERVAAVEENVELLADSVGGLHQSVQGLQQSVQGLQQSVQGLQQNVHSLQKSVGELGAGVRSLRVDVTEMHRGAQEADETVHRLARILLASQRRDDERFSSLDDRVTRLERKTG